MYDYEDFLSSFPCPPPLPLSHPLHSPLSPLPLFFLSLPPVCLLFPSLPPLYLLFPLLSLLASSLSPLPSSFSFIFSLPPPLPPLPAPPSRLPCCSWIIQAMKNDLGRLDRDKVRVLLHNDVTVVLTLDPALFDK